MAKKDDDNSLDVDNEAYIGVDPMYRNHANDTDAPGIAKGKEGAVEREAKEREKEREEKAAKVGFRGYEPNTPHPSEAKQPAGETIDRNRAIQDAQVAAATGGSDGSDDDSNDGESKGEEPFGG